MAVRTTFPGKLISECRAPKSEKDLPAQQAIGVLVRPALPRALRIEKYTSILVANGKRR